ARRDQGGAARAGAGAAHVPVHRGGEAPLDGDSTSDRRTKMILRLCLLAVFLCACDDDSTVASTDLSMAAATDMASNGSCASGLFCAQKCTAQNAQTCGFQCFSLVSADNQPYFQAVVSCIMSKCTSLGGDGGTNACDDPQ